MKRTLICLIFLLSPALARGAWWLENDYTFGANAFKRESLTLFNNISTRTVIGLNASFYRNNAEYHDKVYAFRTPLMHSGEKLFISLKPFIYPASAKIRSRAGGGKLYMLFPLNDGEDESYFHLMFSAAAAEQKTRLNLNGIPVQKTFSEAAFEMQAEKSFYNQFFFLASASAFTKPKRATNDNLMNPALDHSELAYLGTFRTVTALPSWAATAQIARNMAPDYDSFVYGGFSRISYRDADEANSLLGGIKMKLNEKTSLDMAYNYYKPNGSSAREYYKLFLQIFF